MTFSTSPNVRLRLSRQSVPTGCPEIMLSENVNLPCDDACHATVRVTHTQTPSTDLENTPSNLERFPDTAVVNSLDDVICVQNVNMCKGAQDNYLGEARWVTAGTRLTEQEIFEGRATGGLRHCHTPTYLPTRSCGGQSHVGGPGLFVRH